MTTSRIEIREEGDIVEARRAVRDFTKEMGFGIVDQTKVATAASELARNIYRYAKTGEVIMEEVEHPRGVKVTFRDRGPGITDIGRALGEGYSTTAGSLGMGLPGAKRLMDEMTVESEPGKGTTVTILKHLS
ncbi:MAG: anti-sigma regulatory factor [Methanomicrobiales archaeon]